MYNLFPVAEATPISSGLTTVMGEIWSGISSVVTTIATEPLLLIPVGLMFAGALIGLAKKLIGTRKGRR